MTLANRLGSQKDQFNLKKLGHKSHDTIPLNITGLDFHKFFHTWTEQ
jgi:hypothetical protein